MTLYVIWHFKRPSVNDDIAGVSTNNFEQQCVIERGVAESSNNVANHRTGQRNKKRVREVVATGTHTTHTHSSQRSEFKKQTQYLTERYICIEILLADLQRHVVEDHIWKLRMMGEKKPHLLFSCDLFYINMSFVHNWRIVSTQVQESSSFIPEVHLDKYPRKGTLRIVSRPYNVSLRG